MNLNGSGDIIWKSLILQILYILTVVEENETYFRQLSLQNNFYIKDLFYDQANKNYLIFNIDTICYIH